MKNRIIIDSRAPNNLEEQRAAVSFTPLELRGGWKRVCLTLALWTMALLFSGTMALAGTVQLPQTGQTTSYATGDDGDKQMGVAWGTDARFTTGTGEEAECVTDNLTGLTWVKSPDSTIRNWQTAIDYAKGLDLCGFTDWRMPSVIELESMVNADQSNYASNSATWLNTQGFSNVKSSYPYWSSTTNANTKSYAWEVNVDHGDVYPPSKGNNYYVWTVRGGQAAAPADIWETGQTTCYAGGGTLIGCEGTEQDGDLKPGVAWPALRFTKNADGTVTDNLTGLIWLTDANCKDTVGGVAKGSGDLAWANALIWSNSLAAGACGLSDGSAAGDWRLPNRKELLSLVDFEFSNPSLSNAVGTAKWSSGDAFANVLSSNYWSSTTQADRPNHAWRVAMDRGVVSGEYKTYSYYVWPVRGGQSGSLC